MRDFGPNAVFQSDTRVEPARPKNAENPALAANRLARLTPRLAPAACAWQTDGNLKDRQSATEFAL